MKVEIENIKDKLDTSMNRPTPIKRESGMEGKIRWEILGDVGSLCTAACYPQETSVKKERRGRGGRWLGLYTSYMWLGVVVQVLHC